MAMLIPWLVLCLLINWLPQDSREPLLASCLVQKIFNKYLLTGQNYRQNNEGLHLPLCPLLRILDSAIALFSSISDDECLSKKPKAVRLHNMG